jgi:hypothetical protein
MQGDGTVELQMGKGNLWELDGFEYEEWRREIYCTDC